MNTFGTAPLRVVVDAATRITAVDGALAAALGRDPDDLVEAPLSSIVDVDAIDELARDLVDLVQRDRALVTVPRRLRHADGTTLKTIVSIQRRDQDGRFDGFDMAVLIEDDRTQLTPTLPEHLRRLGTAAALIDRGGHIVDSNLGWGLLFAMPAAVAPGGDLLALVHDDDRGLVLELLDELGRSDDISRQLEVRALSDQGDFWARLALSRLDATGGHFTITAEDVSRQHLENRILLSNEALFRSLAEASPIGIARLTTTRRITYANPAWYRLTGVTASEPPDDGDDPLLDDVLLDGADATVAEEISVRLSTRSTDPLQLRLDRSRTLVSLRFSPIDDDEIGLVGHVATIEDISALVADTDRDSRDSILVSAGDLVAIADLRNGAIAYLNTDARQLFLGSHERPDLTIEDIYTPMALARYRDEIEPALGSGRTWTGELTMRRHDGTEIRVGQTMAAEPADDGAPLRLTMLGRVVGDGDTTIEDLVHRATHDQLTGLPNRGLLLDRLEIALARAARDHTPVAVLFVDLDRFKQVNDTLGHDAGDLVLKETAARMSKVLRPSDTVARLGGDEFVILCEDLVDETDGATIAERVLFAIESMPHRVGDVEVTMSASIGIAVAPGGRDVDPHQMLQRSDAAMYRAKEGGRGRVELFDEVQRDRRLRRVQLTDQLDSAIDDARLEVLYQPIVDLRSGRIAAAEGLVRWLHPTEGLLEPAEFLPLAIETRLDVRLDHLVIRRALADAAAWERTTGRRSPPVHVNLFAKTLLDVNVDDTIAAALAAAELDASSLVLELSESTIATEGLREPMHRLRLVGIRFALDDLGAGATVIGRLADRDLSMLKVDHSIVTRASESADGHDLLRATVALGHSLGMVVAAEGVERPSLVPVLVELGVDLAQGRAFSAPVDADALASLLPKRCGIVPRR